VNKAFSIQQEAVGPTLPGKCQHGIRNGHH